MLRKPITCKQWEVIMPYSDTHTFPWAEMQKFISEISNRIGINLTIPTQSQWYQASEFLSLKDSENDTDITFYTYNRPNGTILDPHFPDFVHYEPCKGTENLPYQIYDMVGNGHDTIVLYLITYDDIENLLDNPIFNKSDFAYINPS